MKSKLADRKSCNLISMETKPRTEVMKDGYFQDQLLTMLIQESSPAYTCTNYLSSLDMGAANNSSDQAPPPYTSIDVDCRTKMVQWCFQVIDFAKLQRSTVSIAISLLDRFLSAHETCTHAKQTLHCRKVYQLACMTTLFMAIKMNETTDVNSNVFSDLSRDCFSTSDIIEMEMKILKTLKWKLCLPTALDFIQHLFAILPCLQPGNFLSKESLRQIKAVCIYQLDLAVGDYKFVNLKKSKIAIAALMNVIEFNLLPLCVPYTAIEHEQKTEQQQQEHSNFITSVLYDQLLKELASMINIDACSIPESERIRLTHLLKTNGFQLQSTPTRGSVVNNTSSSSNHKSSSDGFLNPNSHTKMNTNKASVSSIDMKNNSPNCVSSSNSAKDASKPTVADERNKMTRSMSLQDILNSLFRSQIR